MSDYRRGDVVLVPIDFTDRSGAKVRPAVVVSSRDYNLTTPDVLIASITSNTKALPHPGDHRIRDWEAAGLLKASIAQTKVATVEAHTIRRRLGKLTADDLDAFDAGLRKAVGLS